MRLVVLGLSLSSSWGNGHATTWRALLAAFAERGHEVTFLERAVPWYAEHRDLPRPGFCTLHLYHDPDELRSRHADLVATADAVIVGSYVPDGIEVGSWACDTATGVTAFYDIDTPVTLAALAKGTCPYLDEELVARFDLYLSFAGGPVPERLERLHGARRARALPCSVDVKAYRPLPGWTPYRLGYLGTYAPDRQAKLEELLLEPARTMPEERFAVVGAQYPDGIDWPSNVERREHLAPPAHPIFYNAQAWTLNLTRADMVELGHSPSVRLFEAASCGVPIVGDDWPGLAELFPPGEAMLVAATAEDVGRILRDVGEAERRRIAAAARRIVLRRHSSEVRAAELERHLRELLRPRPARRRSAEREPVAAG